MATYFVGDIQGCFDDLQQVLQLAEFDPKHDHLWCTGDLIARGPKSLETLRFIKQLGPAATTVLGNHDLHLLAIDAGFAKLNPKDKTQAILDAPDKAELLDWLRQQPLLAAHPKYPVIMVHAGISPQWSQAQAKRCAAEVEQLLRSDNYTELLSKMYGAQPDLWDDNLTGYDRARFILNAFTRMRFCSANGKLDFHHKHAPSDGYAGADHQYMPWYAVQGPHLQGNHVIFGHWASLEGNCSHSNATTLDTGCVWGNRLTLLRWEDQAVFSVVCPLHAES